MGVLRRVSGWLVSVVALAAFLVCLGLVVGSVARDAWAGMTLTAATPIHTHSDDNTGGGMLALSGSLSSTKACASGYVRTGPNFCMSMPQTGPVNLNADATCRTLAALSGVSDAKAVFVSFWMVALSRAGAGFDRGAVASFYRPNDTTCTGGNPINQAEIREREWSSVTAGTIIAATYVSLVLPSDSAGNVKYIASYPTALSGQVTPLVVGYFD